jgi:hypothetical protein
MSKQEKYKDILKMFDEYLDEAKNYKAVWEVRAFVCESFYE